MASAVQPAEYVEELAAIILKEFAAIPGLRLTEADIRSRWWLTEAESGTILEYLTSTGQIGRGLRGQYCRLNPSGRARVGTAG